VSLSNITSLCTIIESQFALGAGSIHGRWHWDKVWQLGRQIGEKNGADIEVVQLFAYLHDCKRETEEIDAHHGTRSAEYTQELFEKGHLNITAAQLAQLTFACRFHNQDHAQSSDITIQTCWDADRLDLPRVGISVNPEMLFTQAAKNIIMYEK
jgi:uncharacterized protein